MARIASIALGSMVGIVASDARAQVLYGSDVGADQLVTINPGTLVGAPVGPTGAGALTGLAADRINQVLYGIDAGTGGIYKVNKATGQASLIKGGVFTNNANGLAYDENTNVLYVAQLNTNTLHTFDLDTNTATLIGNISGADNIEGLGFDPVTHTLYGLSDGSPEAVYVIDTSTAAAKLLATMTVGGIWRGLDFDLDTGTLYASRVNPTALTTINVNNGLVTNLGPTIGAGTFVQGLAWLGEAPSDCYPDCDASGTLDIDDFICFQTFFAIGDPYADCDEDGSLTIDDFICFQTFFAIGC